MVFGLDLECSKLLPSIFLENFLDLIIDDYCVCLDGVIHRVLLVVWPATYMLSMQNRLLSLHLGLDYEQASPRPWPFEVDKVSRP